MMNYKFNKSNMELASAKTLGNAIISSIFIVIAILGRLIDEEGLMITAMSFGMSFWTIGMHNFIFWCMCQKKLIE